MAATHAVARDLIGRFSASTAVRALRSSDQSTRLCKATARPAVACKRFSTDLSSGSKFVAMAEQPGSSSQGFGTESDVLVSPMRTPRKRTAGISMQATGASSKERVASPAEEAASRLGVNGADYLNDPNRELGRQPVSEGVHPSVQLLVDVLKEEMPKFFGEQGINLSIYRPDVHFQDPQNNWHTLLGFKLNVWVLRLMFFKGRYLMHDIQVTGEKEITARWTFDLPARFLPWTPTVILTGITKYEVDLENAKLSAHIDYWDNLAGKQQKPVSIYALSSVIKQLQPLTAFNIPRDAPHEVIRKTKYYEIRRYAQNLKDPSSESEDWIAVERATGTLVRELQKDKIEMKAEKPLERHLESSWPHKKITEVYIPVDYRPSVNDPVDYVGAEAWRL